MADNELAEAIRHSRDTAENNDDAATCRELQKRLKIGHTCVLRRLHAAIDSGLARRVTVPREGIDGVVKKVTAYVLVEGGEDGEAQA